MKKIYNQLLENNILEENILQDEPMSKHTSFKVGGTAKYFVKACSTEDVKKVIEIVNKNNVPILVLGNGTNILVRDEGFDGIVLKIKTSNIQINKNKVTVDAGVKNAILSAKLLESSLAGFEFASGIPGTIGGAIKMNAGAYGKEIKDVLTEVTYMDMNGNTYTITNKQCNFGYRTSIFKNTNWIILSAKFEFETGNKEEIKKCIKEFKIKRKATQPLEYPNAGSIFKRGEDYITAKLIDDCGLKGFQIGGAQVSEKHAGFIINKQDAKAEDILTLIKYIQKCVKEKFGKEIQLEIDVI